MPEETAAQSNLDLMTLTADIVASYVSGNKLSPTDLAGFIGQVHAALSSTANAKPEQEAQRLVPAVTIKKSVTTDFIICLEDGKKFKSLKGHLRGSFNLSPQEYRVKWSLPYDYPMVAPNYAAIRSKLAKSIGLGNMRQKAKQAATARKTPAVRKSVPKPGKKSTLFMKAAKGR